MKIVGLVGFIGAGKGTVGDYLHLHGFVKVSFAGVLKDTASTLFGWERSLLEGDTPESREFRERKDEWWSERFGYDFSPRLALQWLGTEAGRNVFHKNIWIYALERRIESMRNQYGDENNLKLIVTDTRFINEIQFIHSIGGHVIRVKRGNDPVWFNEFAAITDDARRKNYMNTIGLHESEWSWIGQNIDGTIYNDGTLDDLLNGTMSVLTELKI